MGNINFQTLRSDETILKSMFPAPLLTGPGGQASC